MKPFFKRKEKKEGMTCFPADFKSDPRWAPYYYHRAEAPVNGSAKHSTDCINSVMLCLNFLSVCIALRLWKDLLILPCAKYKNHDQIVSAILGPGHGAFLREYVDGSDDQPILQGNETSLNRGSAVMARRNKKINKNPKSAQNILCLTWLLEALHGATRGDETPRRTISILFLS